MNHYELLGVSQGATAGEIKRAYFSLVKAFPPDRFPEEFKAHRKAYETLSEEKNRARYDLSLDIPEEAKGAFEKASTLVENGNGEYAIELLLPHAQAHPEHAELNRLLGQAYIENENYGKAVKTLEGIAGRDPSARALADLASAYVLRGYTKKATTAAHEALAAGAGAMAYAILADIHLRADEPGKAEAVIAEGFAALSPGEDDSPLLIRAILRCVQEGNADGIEERLAALRRSANTEAAHTLRKMLFELPPLPEREKALHPIFVYLCEAFPDDETIREARDALHANITIRGLKAEGFATFIHELTLAALHGKGTPMVTLVMANAELRGYVDAAYSRKQILRFQKEHPDLYELNKEIYAQMLDAKSEQKNYEAAYKRFMKIKKQHPHAYDVLFANSRDDDEDDEYDDNEYDDNEYDAIDTGGTVVRSEPKIGRNDPCPCGSGKKYKKCCGA